MSFQWWFYCVTNSFPGFLAKAIALDGHLSPVLRISFLRERYYLSKIWALSPFWSVLFLCILPLISLFFFPPTLILCDLFVFYYFFAILFSMSLTLRYRGFPPLGLCLRVMEVRIVMRFFFPYTPWAGILRKVPFPPPLPPYFLCSFFFLFFSFLQAAKLNYVRFENLCVMLFFTLVSSLLRLIAGLYNTLSFVRLSVCRF